MHGAKQLIGRGLVLITLSDLRSIIIYAMIRYADQYSATNITEEEKKTSFSS